MEQHCQRCFGGTAVFDYVVERPRPAIGVDGEPLAQHSPQSWKLCTECKKVVTLFGDDLLE